MITVDIEDSTENISKILSTVSSSLKIPELAKMRVDSLSEKKEDDRFFFLSLHEPHDRTFEAGLVISD